MACCITSHSPLHYLTTLSAIACCTTSQATAHFILYYQPYLTELPAIAKVSPVTNKTVWCSRWWGLAVWTEHQTRPSQVANIFEIRTMFHVSELWREQYSWSHNSSLTVSGLSTASAWQWTHCCPQASDHDLSTHCPSNLPPSHLLRKGRFLTCQRIVLQMSNNLLCNLPNPPLPLPLLFWRTSEFHRPCWGWKFLFV